MQKDTPYLEEKRPASQSQPLWRNRDYMLLWSGQTISLVGGSVSQLAFPLLVLALTRSPAQAGLAGALRALPYLLLSLPAGALIDRWDRKRVMIICDTGRALSLISIPIALAFGRLTIYQLYLTAMIEGTLFVFFNLAQVACLPRVVTKEQLPAATAQNEATSALASLCGPALGGTLYGLRQMLPFLTDALSYAVSVCSLFFIKTPFQKERATRTRKLGDEIMEGLRWLWSQPLIRTLALLTGGSNFVFAGLALIVILLAQRQNASPAVIGIIFAIQGIGGVIGSLVARPLQKKLPFGAVIIGTFWLCTLLWPLYAVAPTPLAIGALSAVFFFLAPIYNVVQLSYRLSLIPDELQGRVNSVFRLLAFGFNPLGLTLTGILLQRLGPISTVFVIAGCLFVLALISLNSHIRKARPIHEVEAA